MLVSDKITPRLFQHKHLRSKVDRTKSLAGSDLLDGLDNTGNVGFCET